MEQAKLIKLLIIDIDGTLTNGIIYYGSGDTQMRGFHVQDGLGLKLLEKSGVTVAVISAKQSDIVIKRLNDLGIVHQYLGYENKIPAFEKLKSLLNLSDEHIAYMGDDLPDLPLLMRVGFAISVPKAAAIIHQHADYITRKEAGEGAVREACELIMQTQGTYEAVIQPYLSHYVESS
jgi:3-deoxy-D-manno-octulosonate 8-phosphate phosphatase (KDO 8-P phosphatase)